MLTGFSDPNTQGVSHIPGLAGNCLKLNGISEYVALDDATPMPFGSGEGFAISGYFRTFDAYGPIFSCRNSLDGDPIIDLCIGTQGGTNDPGKLLLLTRSVGRTVFTQITTGPKVNDGLWHNFVVERSAQGLLSLYVDGVLCGTTNDGAIEYDLQLNGIGAERAWIASQDAVWYVHGNTYLDGLVDEIAVWSGDMKDHQIEALAAIVPSLGDFDLDADVDVADFGILAIDWLKDSATAVQPAVALDDAETYVKDGSPAVTDYWQGNDSGDNGINEMVLLSDPNFGVGDTGQAIGWNYNFDDDTAAVAYYFLKDKRMGLALHDHIHIWVKKKAGSSGNSLQFNFWDAKYIDEPELGNPNHWTFKGSAVIPFASLPDDTWYEWVIDIASVGDLKTCTDLYRISMVVDKGTGDTGSLEFDSLSVNDASTDCVPEVGENITDINGDCIVNLDDFAMFAQNWLLGL